MRIEIYFILTLCQIVGQLLICQLFVAEQLYIHLEKIGHVLTHRNAEEVASL